VARLRVLVTAPIPGEALSRLRESFRVDLNRSGRKLSSREMRRRIARAHGLLCLPSDRIDRTILAAGPHLKGIANCAVGTDNIDLTEAERRGIIVTNTPGVLTAATADLTWALILAVTRRLVEGDRLVRKGRFAGWSPTLLLGRSLEGKVLGVIGMGRIGRAVAARASAFGMRVAYFSRTPLAREDERKLRWRRLPLRKLLSVADVITLHLPSTPETRRLIGPTQLSLMKKGAFLINTSRGDIVDEPALIASLRSGRLAAAGLDVYAREPRIPRALLRMEKTVLLPHIGSATLETRIAMASLAATNLIALLEGRHPPHRVR